MTADKTLVFVLGTGRCGSTVVQELMARHGDVGFISNVDALLPSLDLKGGWNERLYRLTPSAASRRDRAYLTRHVPSIGEHLHFGPSEAYALLRERVGPVFTEPVRDLTAGDAAPWLAKRFRTFFEERMEAQPGPVFLHKLTGWPRARFIQAVFPEARFIHVVRDGRAVAASLVQRPWWEGHLGPDRWPYGPLAIEDRAVWEHSGRDFAVLAGLAWKLLLQAFEASREALPSGSWLDVRFEDVTSDPRAAFSRALSFCDLPWDDAFEQDFHRYPITDEHQDRYRRDLTPESLGFLEQITAPVMQAWGYGPVEVSSGAITS